MRKPALIFVAAIFLPSLLLAWLALRSAQDQRYVIERQQTVLYSAAADDLAEDINVYLGELLRSFTLDVELLLVNEDPLTLARSFDERLRRRSEYAQVGFAIDLQDGLLSPSPGSSRLAELFLLQNESFLTSRETTEVYLNTVPLQTAPTPTPTSESYRTLQQSYAPEARQQTPVRNVFPQQILFPPGQGTPVEPLPSRMVTASGGFRELIGSNRQGSVARFLNNRLNVLFWYRPERADPLLYGGLLDLDRLAKDMPALIHERNRGPTNELCYALLDDTTRAVAVSAEGFTADWKRPFVAAEIGEALPHWEIGVYLRHPERLQQTARTTTLTLGALILTLVAAIALGGWLVARDLRRELAQARRKTDFVSNVSHEFKTPLTSIRMFAELLSEGRVEGEAKQKHYLGIIAAEAARLTRLINNVLDFARMERGEKHYRFERLDLLEVLRTTLATLHPHWEETGYAVEVDLPSSPLPVCGDPDALAQVFMNLLSNAEKYSPAHREIRVEGTARDTPLPHADIRILDRGPGLPPGCADKVFEKFYRAHDTLNSGIQGSGLGLTLARQIARAHGGDVVYSPRHNGGSCFSIRLPLERPAQSPLAS